MYSSSIKGECIPKYRDLFKSQNNLDNYLRGGYFIFAAETAFALVGACLQKLLVCKAAFESKVIQLPE